MRAVLVVSAPVYVGLFAAAACGRAPCTGPPQSPSAAIHGAVDAALSDEFADRLPARAFVERYGRGAVTPDGAALEGPRRHRAPAEYVVQDGDGKPRIVVEEPGLRFLLHVDPGDLRRAPVRAVALASTPGSARASDAGAITLLPGSLVTIVSRERAWIEVKLGDDAFDARGWLPEDALGVVYVPVTPRGVDAQAQVAVRAGSALFERPGGAAIGRFMRTLSVTRRVVRDGFAHIDLERVAPDRNGELSYRARGWVAESDLTADAGEHSVPGAELEVSGSPHRARLRADAHVYAEISGRPIGVTLAEATATVGSIRGEWIELTFETAWGQLTVWAPQTVLDRGIHRRATSDSGLSCP